MFSSLNFGVILFFSLSNLLVERSSGDIRFTKLWFKNYGKLLIIIFYLKFKYPLVVYVLRRTRSLLFMNVLPSEVKTKCPLNTMPSSPK